jgi:hypothetical protein
VQSGQVNNGFQRREYSLEDFYRKHFTREQYYLLDLRNQTAVLNPLLFEIGHAANYTSDRYLHPAEKTGSWLGADRTLNLAKTKSTSSAVKMLLTQPPVYQVRATIGRKGVFIENDSGVRVGDVLKKLEERGQSGQKKVKFYWFGRTCAVFQFEKDHYDKVGTANRIELEKRVGEEWRNDS